MVQNLWRVQFQGGDCPPLRIVPRLSNSGGGQPKCPPLSDSGGDRSRSGGGQKNFRALRARFVPPPELNPVSAPVYIYIYIYRMMKQQLLSNFI